MFAGEYNTVRRDWGLRTDVHNEEVDRPFAGEEQWAKSERGFLPRALPGTCDAGQTVA